jgi:hypothetical protein
MLSLEALRITFHNESAREPCGKTRLGAQNKKKRKIVTYRNIKGKP